MANYYLQRWNLYFVYLMECAKNGKEYNHAELQQAIKNLQDSWPEKKELPWIVHESNVTKQCKLINVFIREKFNDIKADK